MECKLLHYIMAGEKDILHMNANALIRTLNLETEILGWEISKDTQNQIRGQC